MGVIWNYCVACGKPIMVGDVCFEVGVRKEETLCGECHASINEIDTLAAYKEMERDGNG